MISTADVRKALREAWQLVRGLAGERAYEEYLAHQSEHHPGEPVLCERDFWRTHVDRGDTHPSTRCC
jgi:uncharacterized short protein YbdD (DUF466 family)